MMIKYIKANIFGHDKAAVSLMAFVSDAEIVALFANNSVY